MLLKEMIKKLLDKVLVIIIALIEVAIYCGACYFIGKLIPIGTYSPDECGAIVLVIGLILAAVAMISGGHY